MTLLKLAPCACQGSMAQDASMAMEACWIEINGHRMPPGSLVLPEQRLFFVADLSLFDIHGDTVRFELVDDLSGALWIGPVEVPVTGTFDLKAKFDAVLPFTEGAVTLRTTEIISLFPDDVKTFPFTISLSAPDPPPPDQTFLEKYGKWLAAGMIFAGVVVLSPSINRASKTVFRPQEGPR